jgi:Pentapeptide repeats (8 copies)
VIAPPVAHSQGTQIPYGPLWSGSSGNLTVKGACEAFGYIGRALKGGLIMDKLEKAKRLEGMLDKLEEAKRLKGMLSQIAGREISERGREVQRLKDCLSSGDLGREQWNGMRESSDWGLEAIPVMLEDSVKVSLDPPDLWLAELEGADLSGYNLSGAFLAGASLAGACLRHADLSGAHLIVTDLRDADLRYANLSRANLLDADLSRANLSNTILTSALMLRTKVSGTCFSGSNIHGVSVWGLQGIPREQNDLVITTSTEPMITVDDVEVAQFIYLMLNNQKVREVINTITSKAVLILGRFTEERKKVLDALRVELRRRNYLSILFDFDVPKTRNVTETVTLLARMARFIIADLTDPSSIPQELQAIIPSVRVPIQPLLLEGSSLYSLFDVQGLRGFPLGASGVPIQGA